MASLLCLPPDPGHMTNCSDRQRAQDSEASLTIVRSAQAGVTANNVVAAEENVSLSLCSASAHTYGPHNTSYLSSAHSAAHSQLFASAFLLNAKPGHEYQWMYF